jgi:hypothetical protein
VELPRASLYLNPALLQITLINNGGGKLYGIMDQLLVN